MSQIGWIDPADGKRYMFEQALELAAETGEWAGFPYEVLVGMHQQVVGEGRPDGITATQLLGCPRRVHLEKRHDFYSLPDQNYAAFRGVITHSMLEKFKAQDTQVERRVYRSYRGITLSGKFDSLRVTGIPNSDEFLSEWLEWCDRMYELELSQSDEVPLGCEDCRFYAEDPRPEYNARKCQKHEQPKIPKGARFLIRDWKSKDKLPDYVYISLQHQKQGNLYRWLLRIPKQKVDIEFIYVSMQGVRIMRLYDGGVFSNGRKKPKQIWSDEEVERFLEERLVNLHLQEKFDRPLPYDKVPDDDLWNCNFCPARALCYRLAAREARAAWERGESYDRIPPREVKK